MEKRKKDNILMSLFQLVLNIFLNIFHVSVLIKEVINIKQYFGIIMFKKTVLFIQFYLVVIKDQKLK